MHALSELLSSSIVYLFFFFSYFDLYLSTCSPKFLFIIIANNIKGDMIQIQALGHYGCTCIPSMTFEGLLQGATTMSSTGRMGQEET